jgi:hypothetical protein
VDTFLTLVIALGGIATGIGAIWTAVVARRQAQIAEGSFAEQVQSLREQNDRARLTLEYDMMSRLIDRHLNPDWLSRRRAAAKYLLDNAFVDGAMVELEHMNTPLMEMCDFFEELGEMEKHGVVRTESVWGRFGAGAQRYWLVCKPAIEKMRQEREDPALLEEFERLVGVVANLDRERGIGALTPELARKLLEEEAVIGEDPPTTPTE